MFYLISEQMGKLDGGKMYRLIMPTGRKVNVQLDMFNDSVDLIGKPIEIEDLVKDEDEYWYKPKGKVMLGNDGFTVPSIGNGKKSKLSEKCPICKANIIIKMSGVKCSKCNWWFCY